MEDMKIYNAIVGAKMAATIAGTDNYNQLSNQPKINNVTLTGNKSGDDLGLFTSLPAIGICETASNTAAKVVTISEPWELRKGCIIAVKFKYSNGSSTDNVTLNVNETGAMPIYFQGGVYTSHATKATGYANFYIFYMYDGTNWVWLNYSFDSTYSGMSQQEANTGTATADRMISAKVFNDTIAGKTKITATATSVTIGDSSVTDVLFCGNKKINFNVDGTVTWEEVT